MKYSDSAKVCLYNYCRDFGYKDNLDNVKNIIDLDNCNNKDEFIEKLRSIKLDVAITEIPLNFISGEKDVPYFAVCKIENTTIFLPVYMIDKDFVLIKNSKGNTSKIKTFFFEQIYQGEIIEIISNKVFLKRHFLKEEHKKRLIFTLLASIFGVLFITSLVLSIMSNTNENMFNDVFKIIDYIFVGISPVLFIIFLILDLKCIRRLFNSFSRAVLCFIQQNMIKKP